MVHLSLYLGYHSADKFIVPNCSATGNAFLALWYVTVCMWFGFRYLSVLLISYDWSYNWWADVGKVFVSNWWILGASGFERHWFYVSNIQRFYFEVLAFMCCIVDLSLFHKKCQIENLCSIYSVVVWHLEVKNERTCWAESLGICVGGQLEEHVVLLHSPCQTQSSCIFTCCGFLHFQEIIVYLSSSGFWAIF